MLQEYRERKNHCTQDDRGDGIVIIRNKEDYKQALEDLADLKKAKRKSSWVVSRIRLERTS